MAFLGEKYVQVPLCSQQIQLGSIPGQTVWDLRWASGTSTGVPQPYIGFPFYHTTNALRSSVLMFHSHTAHSVLSQTLKASLNNPPPPCRCVTPFSFRNSHLIKTIVILLSLTRAKRLNDSIWNKIIVFSFTVLLRLSQGVTKKNYKTLH